MCVHVHAHVCVWDVLVRGDSWPLQGHLVPVTTRCVCVREHSIGAPCQVLPTHQVPV